MNYRTRTYVAADWDNDIDAVEILRHWNQSNYWGLHFTDAHDLRHARDTSLQCSIKKSLKERLDVSKTFVLIVGKQTALLTKGSCRYCDHYDSRNANCDKGHPTDRRSYVRYECETAYRSKTIKIVVLYNSTAIERNRCPEILRNIGTHQAMLEWGSGKYKRWNYQAIKKALED